jgi:flagellar hook-associated protein 2
MDNPGAYIHSALNGGSGENFILLANDLSAATFALQRVQLQRQAEQLEACISAAALIRSSSLSGFSNALGDRIHSGDLHRALRSAALLSRVSQPLRASRPRSASRSK